MQSRAPRYAIGGPPETELLQLTSKSERRQLVRRFVEAELFPSE